MPLFCENGETGDCFHRADGLCECQDNARYRRRFAVAYAAKHGCDPMPDHAQTGHLQGFESEHKRYVRNSGVALRVLVWVLVPLGVLLGILFAAGLIE